MMLTIKKTECTSRQRSDKDARSRPSNPDHLTFLYLGRLHQPADEWIQKEDFKILLRKPGRGRQEKNSATGLVFSSFLFLILPKSLKARSGVFKDKMENAAIVYR